MMITGGHSKKDRLIPYAVLICIFGTTIAYSGVVGEYHAVFRMVCMGVAGLAGAFQIIRNPRGLSRELLLLFYFALFALISSIYSINPIVSYARCLNLCAVFLLVAGVVSYTTSENADKLMKAVYYSLCFLVLVNLGALGAGGEYGWVRGRFGGVLAHPNSLGKLCLALYPLIYYQLVRKNRGRALWPVSMLALTLFLHLLSYSRASIMAAVIVFGVFFISRIRPRKIVFIAVPVFVLLLLEILIISPKMINPVKNLGWEAISRNQKMTSIKTFNGRIGIWKEAMPYLKMHPLSGYGYDVENAILLVDPEKKENILYQGKRAVSAMEEITFSRHILHNGFLSIAIGVGVGGLLIWLLILFLPLKYSGRFAPGSEYRGLYVSFALFFSGGFITNLFEYALDGGRSIFSIVFWVYWGIIIKIAGSIKAADALSKNASDS